MDETLRLRLTFYLTLGWRRDWPEALRSELGDESAAFASENVMKRIDLNTACN